MGETTQPEDDRPTADVSTDDVAVDQSANDGSGRADQSADDGSGRADLPADDGPRRADLSDPDDHSGQPVPADDTFAWVSNPETTSPVLHIGTIEVIVEAPAPPAHATDATAAPSANSILARLHASRL